MLCELCSFWSGFGSQRFPASFAKHTHLARRISEAFHQDHPGECTTTHNASYKYINTENAASTTPARFYENRNCRPLKTRLVVIQHGTFNTRNRHGRSDAASLFSIFLCFSPGGRVRRSSPC